MKNLVLAITLILSTASAMASTAGCEGKINGKKLTFLAKGSMNNRDNGVGYVKIDGRQVATFDGEAATVSYLRRTFHIENSRGDIVSGKLNNLMSGAATLRRLSLPGEGIELKNVPVRCWFKR